MKTNNYAVYSRQSEGKLVSKPTLSSIRHWMGKALKINVGNLPTEPFSHGGLIKEIDVGDESYAIFKIQHRNSSGAVAAPSNENHKPKPSHRREPIRFRFGDKVLVAPQKRGRTPFDLSPKKIASTNWKRTNKKLSKLLRCSMMTVIRFRKQYGIPPFKRGRPAIGHRR